MAHSSELADGRSHGLERAQAGSVQFRGVHPMFHDSDMRLRGTVAPDGGLDLSTVAAAGHMGMIAKADWED